MKEEKENSRLEDKVADLIEWLESMYYLTGIIMGLIVAQGTDLTTISKFFTVCVFGLAWLPIVIISMIFKLFGGF